MGKGTNDADYMVKRSEKVGSKYRVVWRCPYHVRWEKMLKRCYSDNFHKKSPSYKYCEVFEDWLTFSNFRGWMEKQDWEGKELDKDILLRGNKIYSPDTCIFVHKKVNYFILEGGSDKELPLGVSWHTKDKRFRVRVRNPITGKVEHLGNFLNSGTAHVAWCNRKIELVEVLSEEGYCEPDIIRRKLIERFEDRKMCIEGLIIESDSYQDILDKQRIK